MKVDGVFAGGGVKAFAFIGALQVMEEKGYEFDRIAGTSAGSIIAALIKAGYKSEEIFEMLDQLDIESFKDERMSVLPFAITKWVHMYFRLGLYKGNALENWIKQVLEAKGIKTFGDLPSGSLKVIASDLTKGKLLVLPDDLQQYGVIPEKFPVARAIRMSCSIPYFFEPVKIYDRGSGGKASYIVDGGLLSNFPMWLFMDGNPKRWRKPAIGFQLKPELSEMPPKKIKNAISMYRALFETMTSAHDIKYIDEDHARNIVFIPVLNVKATDFELSEEQKEKLIILGREETNHFLKNWCY
ncbi:patatin-like phospholipase family protein [Alkalihalobacillus sp. MEB130]|uniref:patatin-like phospholipase family protein n=1 Tax=Alkalihalobacillus sp. MEB130 TaxID=2976704 RepID=UPI0028DFE409|nr:patatin-like phospholipase family protein [Alkalihalobacillus sp. MEB130]MDT8862511.1 patatin-like phospholipase family protein [Alkalihalobacillus sp. MEB130]